MDAGKRIFVGSFITNDALYGFFNEIQEALSTDIAHVKWTKTQTNLHLTYHFLGGMPIDEIKRLQSVLHPLLSKKHSFEITISGLNFFTRKGKPAVLFASIKDEQGTLRQLYDEIQELLYLHGFIEQKSDRFTPHITLGRIKKVSTGFYSFVERYRDTFICKQQDIEISIIESLLQPDGALYRQLF